MGYIGGTGAIGLLANGGGYLVIPGKAYAGLDGYTLPDTNGAIMITGKDPTTNVSYIGTTENSDGTNGTQTGMFMIINNGVLNFAGQYIFDNTVIIHRTGSQMMKFNIQSGGKVVISSSVRFEKMTISPTAPRELACVNVEDGAYLYLHTVGFSDYTGGGMIVIDRSLINAGKVSRATFANFQGKVVDENGILFYQGQTSELKSKCPQNATLGDAHECVLDRTQSGAWTLTSFKSKLHPSVTIKYKVYIPKSFDPNKEYPFFMYLHGAGGANMDIATEFYIHSASRNILLESGDEAVVIFPQCPKISGESSEWPFSPTARATLMELIEHVRAHAKVDRQRIYISGHSYGAYGTLKLLSEHPGYFAAAFITSYGTTLSDAACKNIVKTPIRMYCGLNDEYHFAGPMKSLADTLKYTYGGDVEYTQYDDLAHSGVYTRAGNDLSLIHWILAQRAK